MNKSEKNALVHEQALRDFDSVQLSCRDERYQCLSDRRFVDIAGAMWEGPYGLQYSNRPRMEVNKLALAVQRVISEYRNNRMTVYFEPCDGTKDPISDVIEGLYRADEYDSQAQEARDNAFEEACKGGFGAYRLRAVAEDEYDEENDYQRIRFEPIFDADNCVFFDLQAKRRDKSDAKQCWVLTSMTRKAYIEEWGDSDIATWPHNIYSSFFDWVYQDIVYVAEYYKVKEKREKILIFTGLDGTTKKFPAAEIMEDEGLLDELTATGWTQTGEKTVKRRKVHKWIMSGQGILEDCGYIAGTQIPIVPVFGRRSFIDGTERMKGILRDAKDSQRLKNMQVSGLAELAAKSSVEKPIFTPEQVAGHELQWARDNLDDNPYLLINTMTDQSGNPVAAGPVGYTKPPQVAPAMAALLQVTEQDMGDILGNQDKGEELQSNISGRAVELIQNRIDMQSFIYIDNLACAVRRDGEIWLSMAKDIYIDEGRVMKTLNDESAAASSVTLMQPSQDKEGRFEYKNDISSVKMDVRCEVGPSSQSRRSSIVRSLTQMMAITEDQQMKQILGATVLMHLEGQGLNDLRDYSRRQLVQMGAVKPTDEEKEQIAAAAQNQQPSAQDQYLMSEAQKAQALARKAEADTVKTITAADLDRANTEKVYADIGMDARGKELEALNTLQRFIQLQQDQNRPQ